jgi:hypothetical protein
VAAIYVVIGIFVANDHHYFRHINAVKPFISAVLAVLLWPLVLLGINLHIR